MSYIRPRMLAELTVPVFGVSRQKDEQAKGTDTRRIPVRVRRAALTVNDHNQADELEISFDWRDGGIDPRFLKNATVEFYLGDAGDSDAIEADDTTLRFVGVATRVRRIARDESGFVVDMSFQDYTNLFLKSKPFPAEGIPLYSDTLESAWHRICDYTGWHNPNKAGDNKIESNVAFLKEPGNLVFAGKIDRNRTLGSTVPDRFRRLGKFDTAIQANADAWSVWQNVVGSLGLITFIHLDKCIISTSTEFFSDDPESPDRKRPIKMVWGKNIKSFEETAHAEFEGKGVCVTSYDFVSGSTLEAYYPFRDDIEKSPILTKRVVAVKRGQSAPAVDTNRYDFFEYNGVTDPHTLLAIAARAYDERSRQEVTGTLRTSEMFADTIDGKMADLLTLQAGDAIRIELEPFEQETLSSLGTDDAQRKYLESRSYSPEVADLIIANMEAFASLEPIFHVRAVHTYLETDNDGGTFEVDIHFWNRIKVDGDIAADENFDSTVIIGPNTVKTFP